MRQVNSVRRAKVEVLESRVLFAGGAGGDGALAPMPASPGPSPVVVAGAPVGGPPEKFVIPIGGIPQLDWAITAYTDQDPQPGVARDYRGRGYTFDGSDSLHFALADLAAMDRGIDAYAAAPGTVVEAHDGEFDRHVTLINPPRPTITF